MIQTLLFIAGITIVWAMSPGPDFVVVMRNTLVRWRTHWFATSCGVAAALMVHGIIVVAGLWALISASVILYQIIKIWGALYLLHLAIQLRRSSPQSSQENDTNAKNTKLVSLSQSFLSGFITNITNPKVIVFLLALFSQVFTADTTTLTYILSASIIATITLIRFGLVSYLLWNGLIQKKVYKYQTSMNKVFGTMLWALWIKILVE